MSHHYGLLSCSLKQLD